MEGKKGGFKKINEHPNAGKGNFKVNKQNICTNGGRARFTTKFFNEHYSEVEGLGKEEFIKAASKLLEMTEDEWNEIYNNKDTPAWIRLLVTDLMNPKSRAKALVDVMDRLFGKAKEEFQFKGEIQHEHTSLATPIQVIINGNPK